MGEKRATEKSSRAPCWRLMSSLIKWQHSQDTVEEFKPSSQNNFWDIIMTNRQHNHSYLLSHVQGMRHSCPPTSNSTLRNLLIILPQKSTFREHTESLTQNSAYWKHSKDATNHQKMVHSNWKAIGGNKEHDVTANSPYQPVPRKISRAFAFTWSCCNSESRKETETPKTRLEERFIL